MILENDARPLVVCNMSYLENFSGGDKSFIRQMIVLFLKQVPEELANIQLYTETQNFNDLKQAAHKLKSSVALLGAESMSKRLKQMEDLAQPDANEEQLSTLHQELSFLFKEAEQELTYILETL